MGKKCENCGDAISGRIDKKFCSDQCRSYFNNKVNSDINPYMRNVNNTLRKNRRILNLLNTDSPTRVKKSELDKKGFDFGFYTNIYKTKTGKQYYFCYDQGYLKLDNNYYTLVVKKDYI